MYRLIYVFHDLWIDVYILYFNFVATFLPTNKLPLKLYYFKFLCFFLILTVLTARAIVWGVAHTLAARVVAKLTCQRACSGVG